MFLKAKNWIFFFLDSFTFKESYFKIFIFILVFLYFLNSVLYSINIFDSHIFWLFDEAMRFLNGERLYSEIAVVYGVGQPLINSIALIIFGKNVFSVFLITNIFFFLAIFFISLICIKLKFSKIDILFLILLVINIHPTPLIPWSIYLAYFPIILSLYLILEGHKVGVFFSGFFLATAILIRETVLLSAVIIFFFIILENFLKYKKFNNLAFYIAGFLLPLIIFLIYMLLSSNYLIYKELIYSLTSWQTLINIGYYIETDISSLRKFYIFFLAPFRELFLVFVKSLQYFWVNWYLIFLSYFFSTIFLLLRLFKNNYWKEDELIKYKISIISIYCLSLIIQNLHHATINRVATGSVIGIIVLYYMFSKAISNQLVKFISHALIFSLFFSFSLGVSNDFDEINGRLKKFYIISFTNLQNNLDFLISKKQANTFDKKPYVSEFRNMNYDISIHKFYDDIIKICYELRTKKGIKYSDNQTGLWELNYFCKTTPKNYYIATNSEILEENFKKSQLSKKYNSNNNNTIEFYISNDLDFKETFYWDKRGFKKKRKIKDLKILYYVDLKKDYPFLFRLHNSRYFFITQSYKKAQ
jgi:hypothetical protein